MSDNRGNSSREKTTQWLEHVLQTYYTFMERKKKKQGSSGSSGTGTGDGSGRNSSSDLVPVSVIDFDIGPGFSGDGRISTLSDLLSLRVRFMVSRQGTWCVLLVSSVDLYHLYLCMLPPLSACHIKLFHLTCLCFLCFLFQLNGNEEEKTENWIVKIPPNDKADREMAQMAQVDKREIHFYTEALPELEVMYVQPVRKTAQT